MEGIQTRPVVAYVGLALVAALMLVDGVRTAPITVVEEAPRPMEFSFDSDSDVLVGAMLAPIPAATTTPTAGRTAVPVLTVPAVAQSAIRPPVPAPQPAQAPVQSSPAAPAAAPAAAQPAQPRPAGKATKGQGNGKGKASRQRSFDDAGPAKGPAKRPTKARDKGGR